jgi:hypothetical protein
MKIGRFFLVLAIIVPVALAGCAKAEPTPVVEARSGDAEIGPGGPGGPGGALRGATGLALGTLKLEGTEQAVTASQAAELLPLWKMIQGGSLQGQAETDAVLKQIEDQMDQAQLAAIEEMGLTFEDIRAWMEETGIEMPAGPGGPGGSEGPGGPGGPGAFQNMSEEERSRLRQEFQDMTPEQRATRMAEMGIQRPEGGGQGGGPGRQGFAGRAGGNFMLDPLIELLTARAGE